MRHWILGLLSKVVRPNPVSASCRPTLEYLEDRCMPSANTMMSMGMPMPSTNMQPAMQATTMPPTNMQSMGMNATGNVVNPTTLAAIDHLFVDFNQTLQQVLSSKTTQQFITNEIHMIDVLAADIAQIRMLVAPMGRTG